MPDMEMMQRLEEINDKRMDLGLALFDISDFTEAVKWFDAGCPTSEEEQPPDTQDEPETQADEANNDNTSGKEGEPTKPKQVAPAVKLSAPVPQDGKGKEVEQPDNSELAELRKQVQALKSESGRSTKLANEIETLKAQLNDANRRAEEAERKARSGNSGSLMSALSQEVLDAADPETLKAVELMVNEALRSQADNVNQSVEDVRQQLAQRALIDKQNEQRRLEKAQNSMWVEIAQEIPPEIYGEFAGNPLWAQWSDTQYGTMTRGEFFNNAVYVADKDSVVEQMRSFMRFAGIEIPEAEKKPPARPTTSGASSVPQPDSSKNVYSFEDVSRDYRAYLRSNPNNRRFPEGVKNDDEYMKWLDIRIEASGEGRLVDRNGNPQFLSF